MIRTSAVLLSLVAFTSLSESASAADVEQGAKLATRWCAPCHVVSGEQKSAGGQAPPFSEIGKTPGLDTSRLALFLLLPHPKMPDMNLSRSEAADIAAYIQSQGR